MDPLTANYDVVDLSSITKWQDTSTPIYDILVDNPSNMRKSPFPCRPDINEKISLWCGDITQLNVEAIVSSTNETMYDRSILTERLHKRAGPDLWHEIKTNLKGCRTGEAKLTNGYNLPARYVIHTVGPRYNLKYKTAAESALYCSYRSVMQVIREHSIHTIALGCIHTLMRSYPSYEGAHIAIRTIRRALEKDSDGIKRILFVVVGDDKEIYSNLLPLYFPRTQNEEDFSAYHLPYDVGNSDGEPVIKEREIRINQNLTSKSEDDITSTFESSVAIGSHAFSKMESDSDNQRKNMLKHHILKTRAREYLQEQSKRYERWLKRSKTENLASISSLQCLYHSGHDAAGRPVVVFIARNLVPSTIDLEKAAMHFINVMDPIVSKPYVFIYFHTLSTKVNQLEVSFLKEMYQIVDSRYKRNLHALYVVHPSLWSKVVTWFLTTFTATEVKSKVKCVPGLEYLHRQIAPDQLDLPDFIPDYDLRVNGTRYYNPDEDNLSDRL